MPKREDRHGSRSNRHHGASPDVDPGYDARMYATSPTKAPVKQSLVPDYEILSDDSPQTGFGTGKKKRKHRSLSRSPSRKKSKKESKKKSKKSSRSNSVDRDERERSESRKHKKKAHTPPPSPSPPRTNKPETQKRRASPPRGYAAPGSPSSRAVSPPRAYQLAARPPPDPDRQRVRDRSPVRRASPTSYR